MRDFLTCKISGGIPLDSLPSTRTDFCGNGYSGSGLDSTVCSRPINLYTAVISAVMFTRMLANKSCL